MNNPDISPLFSALEKLKENYVKAYTGNFFTVPAENCFKIGNLKIANPLITAPLAGISDNTFRIFAKCFGSGLNYTEMISGYGVHFKNRETITMSHITGYERPCGIQIFSSEPDIIAEAAAVMEEKADLIDINMGCPVPKVLKTKSGGFLLTDEERVEKIIKKTREKIKKPLTIKIRTGWDKNSENALRISRIAEDCGADAVIIHGRTVKQGFAGRVNYELIKDIKNVLKIPVIASGDIDNPLKAVNVKFYTNCDGIMIGRAARGRLWIFYNILNALNCSEKYGRLPGANTSPVKNNFFMDPDILVNLPGQPGPMADYNPPVEFKKAYALLYLSFLVYFLNEEQAVREFRKHFAWIFKAEDNISRFRQKFNSVFTINDAEELIKMV